MPSGIEENVVRLDIAVDVALRVNEVEGGGHVRQPPEQLRPSHRCLPFVLALAQ